MTEQGRNGTGSPKAVEGTLASVALPDPEVRVVVRRRVFSAAYKQDILRQAAACRRGELGALLRREGLYSSHLSDWRRQVAAEGPAGLAPKKRGPKPSPEERRVAELERDLARTRKRLEQAEAIIDAQKKLSALMTLAEQSSIGAFS
jgi:transposase-like protein